MSDNLLCLESILDHNQRAGFRFFRIASETIPFASHPVNTVDWKKEFRPVLERLGKKIKDYGFRISMHPDQFVLINSPSVSILDKSIAELKFHCDLLDLMNLDSSAKVQIHVGGVYNDKPGAMSRFAERYRDLPAEIKKRLVIEHDDRLFSLKDCLLIFEQTGVPILFDNFHHECLNNGESVSEALKAVSSTWRSNDGIPLVDFSHQQNGARMGQHAQSISVDLFKKFLSDLGGMDVDIMLEIKDKEKSASKVLSLVEKRNAGLN